MARNSNVSFRGAWCRAGVSFAFLLMVCAFPVSATAGEAADRIRACFEGPASEAAAGTVDADDFTRQMSEMVAGRQCQQLADEVIQACLGEIDNGVDDAESSYACIGIVANPCMDSDWAIDEFRSVVCIGTEEAVWLQILHTSLDSMRSVLTDDQNQQLVSMQEAFFEYRNAKCGLIRQLRSDNEPDIAYGACTTETAARLAIDLREMAAATVDEAGPQADEEPAADQPESEDIENRLGSRDFPVRTDGPAGQKAYLGRLRCPDGTVPDFNRQGSVGYGGYGNIVDVYSVRCRGAGESDRIYMDMYHPGYIETAPVTGYEITDDR